VKRAQSSFHPGLLFSRERDKESGRVIMALLLSYATYWSIRAGVEVAYTAIVLENLGTQKALIYKAFME
jgi:hypothetical protein